MINIPYEDAALFPEPDNNWKTPVTLSLIVHLLILLLALLPATLFEPNLHLEEVYTVDLFEVLDNGNVRKISPPAPPVKADKPVKPVAPPPEVKPVLAEIPQPQPQVVSTAQQPEEVISLAPRLRKKDLRKEKDTARKEEEKLAGALEKIKSRLRRQQAAAEAKEAKAAAAAAVNDALAQLRASIHSSSQVTNTQVAAGSGSIGEGGAGQGRGQVMDAALRQYYIAVSQHIHRYWILPEGQEWDKNLTAVYVVNVRRDGIVSKNYFETKSKDHYFNLFVEKTMKGALPLPPFPSALKEEELEIGLVFHPAGLE